MAAAGNDNYPGTNSLLAPSNQWVVITPNDTNTLTHIPKAIALGGDSNAPAAGAVVLVDSSGNEATFWMVKGQVLSVRPVKVKNTGTTASLVIIGLL